MLNHYFLGSDKQVASACKSSITWKEIIKGTWNYKCYNLRHRKAQEVPGEAIHQPQTHPKNNHQLLKIHVLHVCWVLCQKVMLTAGGESRLVKPNIKNSKENRQQKHDQRNWLIRENLNAEKSARTRASSCPSPRYLTEKLGLVNSWKYDFMNWHMGIILPVKYSPQVN